MRLGRGPVPTSRRHRGFGKQAEESRAAQCQSERRTPPAEVAETVIKAQGPRLFVQSSSHVGICLVGTVQYRVLLVLGSVLSRLLSPGACELTFSSSPSSCASSLFQPESRCDGGRWREGEKVDGPGSSGSSWTKADMVGHDPGRPSSRPYPYPYPWSGEAENSTAGREEQETRQRSVCGQVGRTTQPQISLERALLLLSPPLFRISHLAPADGWHLMRRGQGLDSAMGSVKCAVCSVQRRDAPAGTSPASLSLSASMSQVQRRKVCSTSASSSLLASGYSRLRGPAPAPRRYRARPVRGTGYHIT